MQNSEFRMQKSECRVQRDRRHHSEFFILHSALLLHREYVALPENDVLLALELNLGARVFAVEDGVAPERGHQPALVGEPAPQVPQRAMPPSSNEIFPKRAPPCIEVGLTFDMRGGRKQAKPAGGRPLDGRVRRRLRQSARAHRLARTHRLCHATLCLDPAGAR